MDRFLRSNPGLASRYPAPGQLPRAAVRPGPRADTLLLPPRRAGDVYEPDAEPELGGAAPRRPGRAGVDGLGNRRSPRSLFERAPAPSRDVRGVHLGEAAAAAADLADALPPRTTSSVCAELRRGSRLGLISPPRPVRAVPDCCGSPSGRLSLVQQRRASPNMAQAARRLTGRARILLSVTPVPGRRRRGGAKLLGLAPGEPVPDQPDRHSAVGPTVATNTLLERKGRRCVLVITGVGYVPWDRLPEPACHVSTSTCVPAVGGLRGYGVPGERGRRPAVVRPRRGRRRIPSCVPRRPTRFAAAVVWCTGSDPQHEVAYGGSVAIGSARVGRSAHQQPADAPCVAGATPAVVDASVPCAAAAWTRSPACLDRGGPIRLSRATTADRARRLAGEDWSSGPAGRRRGAVAHTAARLDRVIRLNIMKHINTTVQLITRKLSGGSN